MKFLKKRRNLKIHCKGNEEKRERKKTAEKKIEMPNN